MHWLTSYVGCISTLMANSGIEEILKCRFGVAKMLSGKNFPSNICALRLLVEEMLRGHITNLESYQEMMDILHDVSSRSRTSKHWVENLIKPVFLIMPFVRVDSQTSGGKPNKTSLLDNGIRSYSERGGLAITLICMFTNAPLFLCCRTQYLCAIW